MGIIRMISCLSELKGTQGGRVPSDTYLVLNDNRGRSLKIAVSLRYIAKIRSKSRESASLSLNRTFGFIRSRRIAEAIFPYKNYQKELQ